jgi:pyruvate kinase
MERVFQKTKIIATVGPACNTYDKLLRLAEEGVDVFRLNFSHGTHEDHKKVIDHINKINEEFLFKIAILGDLQGPKLRVGQMEGDGVLLKEGDEILISNEEILGTAKQIYISYPNFYEDVEPGETIFFDDGKIEMKVKSLNSDKTVTMEVVIGGVLSSRKGMNLPQTKISIPAITEKDKKDVKFAAEQRLDWVALSFVRKPKDVSELRNMLRAYGSEAKVIAKIEKPEVLDVLRDVIVESDGIMIARGDLGVELPMAKVPMIQKEIVRMCIHRAKPVIIATQMMESMMERTKPNRSEITDVANAVLDGADALMLSGETAVGKHPALVIKSMANIITEVEKEENLYHREDLTPQEHSPSFLSDAVCYRASKMSVDVKADALIGNTQSGYTGFMLSSFRPKAPLFVFTKTKSLVHQLSLSWGVRAIFFEQAESLDDIIQDQITALKERDLVKEGDVVVVTGSTPVEEQLPTNLIKVTRVK